MEEQLTLAPPVLPDEVPEPVLAILQAARSTSFKAQIAKRTWGVGIGQKRKWVLNAPCCCALSALLIVRGSRAEEREYSPIHAAARELGVRESDVYEFVQGYDGHEPQDAGLHGFGNTIWYEYGRWVAQELGITEHEIHPRYEARPIPR
jgi:hypothetical protein